MNINKKSRNIIAACFFLLFSLLFFILLIRFITIQYTGEVDGRVLAEKREELYLREGILKARRGTIYDQNGEVIAEDTESFTLVAVLDENLTTNENYPRHVVDPKETARQLANYIDMPENEIYEILTKDRKQVEFGRAGRDLPHHVKEKIEELNLPGIGFIKETKRFYPNGIFASHLIGYAQKEQKKNEPPVIEGKMGLERSYNELLTGKDGLIQYQGDKWNYILPAAEELVEEPQDGHDIYLTIDKRIQTFLEDAMTKVDELYSPTRIMAVVADPKTGKILAMGQRPTFHPETRMGIDQTWHNEIIESSFEPGSTMKIFSLAAAVDQGVFNPNETFQSGQYRVDLLSPPIHDHRRGGWGRITYLEGVQRSSNVAFAYLLEKMGTETWREYMDRFGFGKKTNIHLPNEVTGSILYNYPIEKVTSVYGQGTTVTAIQMVQAMTAIANNGVMMKPYVVEKIVNPNDGTVQETKPEVVGQPISKETAQEVIEILETVITGEYGTGKNYAIDGYRVAGKTGTAQISDPNGGGYLQGRNNYIFSFLGLAPVEDPQLIMYVLVEKPQLAENENGSVPVSMIFNSVMKSSLQYLNIRSNDSTSLNIVNVPNVIGMNKDKASDLLMKENLRPIIIGSGDVIVDQSLKNNEAVIEGEKIFLKTDGKPTIPDMTGWSKREVLTFGQMAGIHIDMIGEGYVYKQSVKSNTPVEIGSQVTVSFETSRESFYNLNEVSEGEEPLD